MEVKLEKSFNLTTQEYQDYQRYMEWATENPLPCWNCAAVLAGKCSSYKIWDKKIEDGETCPIIEDWFKLREEKCNPVTMLNVTDEDFKKLFNNELNLKRAEREKGKSEIIYALNKDRYNKENVISKIRRREPHV